MNTRIIIGIVIVIVILALGFLLFQNKAQAPESSTAGIVEDEAASGEGESMMVPAPGHEGVDEMVVNEDGAMDGGTEMRDKEPTVIRYDGNTFSPKSVTIAAGERVIWVNEGSRPMWVASAMHPTHAVYPEKTAGDCLGSAFDSCEGVAGDGSWSFTFTSAGTWKYHDHLRASNFGEVIVQ